MNNFIFGIDLGTTTSCIAIYINGKPFVIEEIPSYVAFTPLTRYIGIDAKNQKYINSENVFYEVKRLIGRKYNDEKLQLEKKLLSYNLKSDDNNNILISSSFNKNYTPEEILAAILNYLKNKAIDWVKINHNINIDTISSVITIPAYFSDLQRSALIDSAKIAQIKCVRIINEPTAAILAFGYLSKQINYTDSKIIVYDFGGGTLDISLIEISQGVYTVLGSAGNPVLGGSNFDKCLMQYCIELFQKSTNINISTLLSTSIQKLRNECEDAKKRLSINNKTTINVDNFYENYNLSIQITRKDFENICKDILDICIQPIDNLLNECSLSISDIDDIILIGGMTKMPIIRELIKKQYREPNCSINPETAVALGASIQAHILSHNHDEYTDQIVLLDITSLSLGIETSGGIMDTLIKRGTILPHKINKYYTTDTDNMTSILIKIYEGERTYVKDNIFIGEFELIIPPAPKMIPEINVCFEITIDGIVIVSAELIDSEQTNIKNQIIVTNNKQKFNDIEINKLINDAKQYEIEDELKKNIYLLRYQIYNMSDIIIKNGNSDTITNDINNIIKNIDNINELSELKNILENIGYKYGNIAIKQIQDTNIELTHENITSTYTTVNDDENNNIDAKKILLYHCNNIYNKLNINNHHDILNYIDDIIIWLNITNNPQKDDIDQKLIKLLVMFNQIDQSTYNRTDELEKLCFSLKIISESNELNKDLLILVNDALNYLEEDNPDNNIIIEYIDKINELCDSII